MALFPTSTETKFKLQPGANGELFVANQPGARGGEPRINRTNNTLNVTPHEAISQKYILDTRLKPLFKYGYAVGYNYMTVPKGRIVAVDPFRDTKDWTSDKLFNTLTLANGGTPVTLRKDSDTYGSVLVSTEAANQKANEIGLEWAPATGLAAAYADGAYRSCKTSAAAQLTEANLAIDTTSGNVATAKVTKDEKGAVSKIEVGTVTLAARPGNVPLGMIERNEYQRFENDSMDGKQPGPIITDAIVELPLFGFKDKAEQNPWGSIYGNVHVGDLVKSDENGRITISPLSVDAALEKMTSIAEVERERQQVIGQVVGVSHDMVPEGGYKWATWSLEDRMKFQGFAPDMYTQTNRPGEDNINSSAYQSEGRYPGYPYDQAYTEHDLQMLGSGTGRSDNYNKFMDQQYLYDNLGIPGLTDGANVAVKNYENNHAAVILPRKNTAEPYVKQYVKVSPSGNVIDGSVKLTIVDEKGAKIVDGVQIDSTKALPFALTSSDADVALTVTYYDALQGMIVIEVADAAKMDTKAAANKQYIVNVAYQKRGEAGVPTFMDWDGCVGSAKILLQR